MAGTWTDLASRSREVVQALSETTGPGSEGINLAKVQSVVPVLHAPGGQTFTGAGRLHGYVWDGTIWVASPNSDIDMAGAAGLTDWSPGALIVDSPRGRFQLIPVGVTLSGAGTTITTDYYCTTQADVGAAV